MRTSPIRFGYPGVLALFALAALTPCAVPPRPSRDAAQDQPVYFEADVVPLLTKLGCNSGGCHGKAEGQNGFKLSLLGFEPDQDYEAIVQEARGRRLLPSSPGSSLLLLKATGTLAHGGGKRLAVGSEDYQTLRRWIEKGAPPARGSDPTLRSITVTPAGETFDAGNRSRPLRITAHFSDGTSRDVTRQAVYQPNEPDIAEVDETGTVRVKNRSGLFAVMVRYGEQLAVFYGTVPHDHEEAGKGSLLAAWEKANPVSGIDKHLVANWKRLGVVPSRPASDEEFVRRASLDICGTLPTPEEVKTYLADKRPGQAGEADRPPSGTAGVRQLLRAEVGRHPAEPRPWLQHQPAASWDRLVRGLDTRRRRRQHGLRPLRGRDPHGVGQPGDQPADRLVSRRRRTSAEYVESVAQAFLGIRIQCAQCHHHPAERWSQADYYQFAAVFARVGARAGSPTPRFPRARRSSWPTPAKSFIPAPKR